ncbi:MAG: tRNA (adenosine(37)-N6)-threonylcarbamoyltransferase complex dimerization subunit type 1 TsaB [Flavobacteriales bacterium]|nr:tRNA (adenosine(37)-N6)-threonylcarbamoyltransferase complex dimerization subunit type 1 TsaB [Flavobacteriales bacterium]
MSVFLCLDTSTKACSVALVNEHGTIEERNLIEDNYTHAEKLHVIIDELLTTSEIKLSELTAIAVGKGPGSYTGLRIGVSAAKGFAFGSNIPLISIPTLQTMSSFALDKGKIEKGILRPLLDARRMEVYSAAYDLDLNESKECKALLLEEDPFHSELDSGVVHFFGDGMEKARKLLSKHPNASFIEDVYPRASCMRPIVLEKWKSKDFEDTAYFEPFYLKDFIAKLPKKMV